MNRQISISHLTFVVKNVEKSAQLFYELFDAKDFQTYQEKIVDLGLSIKEDRSRIAEEAQSLYFYDYDNHLFELHTGTLEQRLAGYLYNGK